MRHTKPWQMLRVENKGQATPSGVVYRSRRCPQKGKSRCTGLSLQIGGWFQNRPSNPPGLLHLLSDENCQMLFHPSHSAS